MGDLIAKIERAMAKLSAYNIEPTRIYLGVAEFDIVEAHWQRYLGAHSISKTGGVLLGLKLHFVEDESHCEVS